MAISKKNTASKTTSAATFEKADAWLNLELVDAKGNRHKLPKGVAQYLKDHVSAQMVKAQAANPDLEFHFVGKIIVPTEQSQKEIPFV